MNILYPFVALFYLYMLFESSSLCLSHCRFKNWDVSNGPAALRDPEERPMKAPTALVTVRLWGFRVVCFPKSHLDFFSFLSDTLSLVAPLVLPDLSSSLWRFPVPLQNNGYPSCTSFIPDRLWAQRCNHTFQITSTFHRPSSLCLLGKN